MRHFSILKNHMMRGIGFDTKIDKYTVINKNNEGASMFNLQKVSDSQMFYTNSG